MNEWIELKWIVSMFIHSFYFSSVHFKHFIIKRKKRNIHCQHIIMIIFENYSNSLITKTTTTTTTMNIIINTDDHHQHQTQWSDKNSIHMTFILWRKNSFRVLMCVCMFIIMIGYQEIFQRFFFLHSNWKK